MPEPNVFDSKLFWQYMSGAGAALSEGESVAGALDKVFQQSTSATSMTGLMGMFQKMLKGEMPEGAGYKVDSKGMSLTIPKMHLDKLSGEKGDLFGPGEGLSLGATPPGGTAPQAPQTPFSVQAPEMPNLPAPVGGGGGGGKAGALMKLLNPSSSLPNISASDLAGLSTTDISNALSGMLGVEGLDQKKITDVSSMLLQASQARLADARARELGVGYPIPVPGVGRVSRTEWNNLPSSIREHAAYVAQAKALGDSDIMTLKEFENEFSLTERGKFLRDWLKHPEIAAADLASRKAGASQINIGQKVEEKKAMADLGGQLYFKNPKWTDDLAKHMSSKGVRGRIMESTDEPRRRSIEKIRYIEDKILAGGGELVDVKLAEDNRTMIWTVEWPNGDKETIKHVIRD